MKTYLVVTPRSGGTTVLRASGGEILHSCPDVRSWAPRIVAGPEGTMLSSRQASAESPYAIEAIELETGATRWRAPVRDNPYVLWPVGDVLYTADTDLNAFDTRTGALRFRREGVSREQFISLYADATLLLVGSGGVASFDPASGNPRWDSQVSSDGKLDRRGDIVFGAGWACAFALARDTGKTLWKTRVPGNHNMDDPLLMGDVLLTATLYAKGLVGAFACRDGRWLWRANVGRRHASPLVAHRDDVVVSDAEGTVSVFEAATGLPRWTYRTRCEEEPRVCLRGGALFFGSGGVHAVDARRGERIWHVATERFAEVAGVDDVAVYASTPERVLALRKADGALLWERAMHDPAWKYAALPLAVLQPHAPAAPREE